MKRLSAIFILAVLAATLPSAEPVKAASIEGVTEYRLPNGLRVLLMPDASRPLVHVQCTVLVGSRHEGYGEAGMAHLLEHMLVKGTKTHPDIMKSLRDRGAVNANAYTSQDTTRFVESLPATDENLEFAIRLEADRLVNSVVKREELITEMTVVRNEFERRENEATQLLVERMSHAAFRWHNYGKTVLGNRSDIERVPVDNLQAFYKKHYRPDNTVLVITGRIDEAKTLALVVKHFGPIAKPEEPLAKTYTQEPAQDGERHVVLRRAGAVGGVGAVYHMPAGSHPDYPAIMVLVNSLGSEPSGRLYKALVESKKAAAAGAEAAGLHDPWLMQFVARVEDPAGIDAARDTLLKTLESLAEQPITEEEVERTRKKFTPMYEQFLADSGTMADQPSFYAGAGDWRLLFWERDSCDKVTVADVNRVAAKYLTRNNRTVGVYYPTKQAERIDIPETTDVATRMNGYVGRKKEVSAAEAFDPTHENIEMRVIRGSLGNIKTAFLPKPTRGELVNLDLTLRFGNEQVLKSKVTASQLLPSMFVHGTKTHTRQQFVDALDKLKGGVVVTGAAGRLNVRVLAKKESLAPTLALVRQMLREPAFPAAEFETLKATMLTNLAAMKTEPAALAAVAVQRKLRSNHARDDIRYEPTIDEQIERVKAVTLEDVKSLYTELVAASAGELGVVGDFDPKVVIAGLEPALVGWTGKAEYRRIAKPAKALERGESLRIETPDKANAVYFAALTYPLSDNDADYPALAVGTYLLGEHPIVSRLGSRIRKEKGLSYGVQAEFAAETLDPAAVFAIVGSTNPVNMAKVRETIVEELKKFLDDGVGEAELNEAKKAYLEEMKVNLAEDAGLASRLGMGLHLSRTFHDRTERMKRIEALTPADIQRAFRRVIDPAKLVIAEAGDFAKVDGKVSANSTK